MSGFVASLDLESRSWHKGRQSPYMYHFALRPARLLLAGEAMAVSLTERNCSAYCSYSYFPSRCYNPTLLFDVLVIKGEEEKEKGL